MVTSNCSTATRRQPRRFLRADRRRRQHDGRIFPLYRPWRQIIDINMGCPAKEGAVPRDAGRAAGRLRTVVGAAGWPPFFSKFAPAGTRPTRLRRHHRPLKSPASSRHPAAPPVAGTIAGVKSRVPSRGGHHGCWFPLSEKWLLLSSPGILYFV